MNKTVTFIKKNEPLWRAYTYRYLRLKKSSYLWSKDDFFSLAYVAAKKAENKFKPLLGTKFETLFLQCFKAELSKFLYAIECCSFDYVSENDIYDVDDSDNNKKGRPYLLAALIYRFLKNYRGGKYAQKRFIFHSYFFKFKGDIESTAEFHQCSTTRISQIINKEIPNLVKPFINYDYYFSELKERKFKNEGS